MLQLETKMADNSSYPNNTKKHRGLSLVALLIVGIADYYQEISDSCSSRLISVLYMTDCFYIYLTGQTKLT